jgi:hypothetical protein
VIKEARTKGKERNRRRLNGLLKKSDVTRERRRALDEVAWLGC